MMGEWFSEDAPDLLYEVMRLRNEATGWEKAAHDLAWQESWLRGKAA